MARNSVTGRFRDIEIVFSIDSDCIIMSVQNLADAERRVRVMYQKLSMSGLANWAQFELTNTPISRRLPTEILDAYRLTFFVDNAEPVSARMEKILDELHTLKADQSEITPEQIAELNASEPESQTQDTVDVPAPALKSSEDITTEDTTSPLGVHSSTDVPPVPEIETTQDLEKTVVSVSEVEPIEPVSAPLEISGVADAPTAPEVEEKQQVEAPETDLSDVEIPEPVETNIDESKHHVYGDETIEQVIENTQQVVEEAEPVSPTAERQPEGKQASVVSKLPPTHANESISRTVDTKVEFKIEIPSFPPSALAERRKAEAAKLNAEDTKVSKILSKRKEKGVFGHLAEALGLTAGGRRGKAYYQEKGEAVQNEFQDQLAKLERDYNEGYGLNLSDWDPETLCEEEIAILLLNLMVTEVITWRKEIGRATHETEQLVQTLDEVDVRLRQTLKQTRGMSTPSPTLFPDLLAENGRDLEKIQSECDAYLRRFASKLIEQEKKHASKIEVIIFKKFLIEFIRDFLFVEVTKSIKGNELPERLEWFLDLVDSEVIPIEVGVTRVSQNHHKVKGALASEFELGTIVEVISPGLQSKDGKRVSQMAVVIEAE